MDDRVGLTRSPSRHPLHDTGLDIQATQAGVSSPTLCILQCCLQCCLLSHSLPLYPVLPPSCPPPPFKPPCLAPVAVLCTPVSSVSCVLPFHSCLSQIHIAFSCPRFFQTPALFAPVLAPALSSTPYLFPLSPFTPTASSHTSRSPPELIAAQLAVSKMETNPACCVWPRLHVYVV